MRWSAGDASTSALPVQSGNRGLHPAAPAGGRRGRTPDTTHTRHSPRRTRRIGSGGKHGTRRRSQPARAPCPEPSAAATSPPCGPPSASLAHIPRRMRGHLVEISSNHCKALRALRPCSCRLNGIQPVSRHREPGTARGRKGMKTQPRGRLPQTGAVSTHARMQTARDCTLAPHTHQVS